jgi:hypothetical protein
MGAFLSLLGILALFTILAIFMARVDGLAFMAPRSTRGIRASAHGFCTDSCRSGGLCPLTGTTERAGNCPLWQYVEADVPTTVYGNPFVPLRH